MAGGTGGAGDGAMSTVFRAEFDPVPASAGAARRSLRDAVDGRVARPDLLELFTSELATNAIVHARTRFAVRADIGSGVVRVSVTDGDAHVPSAQSPEPTAITGRGLRMISDQADRWGVDTGPGGKTVWFELPTSSSEPPRP